MERGRSWETTKCFTLSESFWEVLVNVTLALSPASSVTFVALTRFSFPQFSPVSFCLKEAPREVSRQMIDININKFISQVRKQIQAGKFGYKVSFYKANPISLLMSIIKSDICPWKSISQDTKSKIVTGQLQLL